MNSTHSTQAGADPLSVAEDALAQFPNDAQQLNRARQSLLAIAESAREAARGDLHTCAVLLAQLLEIVRCANDGAQNAASEDLKSMVDFVVLGLTALRAAVQEEAGSAECLEELIRDAHEQWDDYLGLLDTSDTPAVLDAEAAWNTPQLDADLAADQDDAETPRDDQGEWLANDQINLLLSALGENGITTSAEKRGQTPSGSRGSAPFFQQSLAEPAADLPAQAQLPVQFTAQLTALEPATATTPSRHEAGTLLPAAQQPVEMDDALLEAYLDDAQNCLASIEVSVLTLENEPGNRQAAEQLCRGLHTLKGASSSVGLTNLAAYLHEVEDTVQSGHSADVGGLLAAIDVIRQQVAALSPNSQLAAPSGAAAARSPAAASARGTSGQTSSAALEPPAEHNEETVRVKASQLDRLMDMLAELVMLRNRRDSRVERLKEINGEVIRCVTKLRVLNDGAAAWRMDEAAQAAQRANPLTEVANDLLEFARSLRELYEPVADENLVISRFIRQFRQELVQLRRSPMSDLFRRLQRAVRDAATAEGKKVRLELIGDHAGLERSLQERLYEPLLHIVRNAVSHGIEPEDQRTARGKPPSGTITLEARGGTNLLLVEVRDDGRGLDYDALRRRGVERGLLSGDRSPSREELAQLIFRPGFSTRDTASEISGRGVGMDVVAATLDRMRGWVEVESTPGHGMTIRLTVPLRSVIEHAMVFRAAGQLFAVPMPYVQQAAVWDSDVEQLRRRSPAGAELRVLDFRELFSMPVAPANAPSQMLLLGHAQPALTADEQTSAAKRSNGFPRSSQHVALLVDEVVGPEEVVVRPLPALLKHRRLFSGVTLAGTGQMVLLFDARRLIERGLNHAGGPQPHKTAQDRFPPKFAARKELSRFLVVDDSPSTRRSLTQMLERRGFTTTEAGDGLEAVSRLRDGHFAAVFTDLEMPRLGGMELLRQIKSRRETRCLPVVIVSSCQEAQHRDRAKELGATDYLAKPVSDEVLTETIERIMAILEATKN